MKKYLWTASLFLFGNEVLSWLVLCILAVMGAIDLYREYERWERWKDR